eukprot:gnl/TRDRNA2_/TRDRNA2_171025_c1_seq1.p1 gnl/TRDRNA2_/TRDRNA2_171025_c1~~gnl/TRDRNA2_/TRDRNA2_171025_c1_seq1.p1  ORF type:complete len:661 (-),score=139.84 gnl/TRDRNA2_/TRDRNA2_171025_c1_seq1:133-2115(-)
MATFASRQPQAGRGRGAIDVSALAMQVAMSSVQQLQASAHRPRRQSAVGRHPDPAALPRAAAVRRASCGPTSRSLESARAGGSRAMSDDENSSEGCSPVTHPQSCARTPGKCALVRNMERIGYEGMAPPCSVMKERPAEVAVNPFALSKADIQAEQKRLRAEEREAEEREERRRSFAASDGARNVQADLSTTKPSTRDDKSQEEADTVVPPPWLATAPIASPRTWGELPKHSPPKELLTPPGEASKSTDSRPLSPKAKRRRSSGRSGAAVPRRPRPGVDLFGGESDGLIAIAVTGSNPKPRSRGTDTAAAQPAPTTVSLTALVTAGIAGSTQAMQPEPADKVARSGPRVEDPKPREPATSSRAHSRTVPIVSSAPSAAALPSSTAPGQVKPSTTKPPACSSAGACTTTQKAMPDVRPQHGASAEPGCGVKRKNVFGVTSSEQETKRLRLLDELRTLDERLAQRQQAKEESDARMEELATAKSRLENEMQTQGAGKAGLVKMVDAMHKKCCELKKHLQRKDGGGADAETLGQELVDLEELVANAREHLTQQEQLTQTAAQRSKATEEIQSLRLLQQRQLERIAQDEEERKELVMQLRDVEGDLVEGDAEQMGNSAAAMSSRKNVAATRKKIATTAANGQPCGVKRRMSMKGPPVAPTTIRS